MDDRYYMNVAIDLAGKAAGQTSPNPVVGSVVVKDGEIVGFGAHLKAGEAHAEVHAIRMAGEKVIGSTVYVTLEPCSHHGRTPPCSDLLISSQVKRVVIASVDPNPLVAGSGIKKLKSAGIIVDVGVCEAEALALNDVFFHYIKTKKPYVTLKTASSLDGKTATYTKDSKWITGEEARMDVHRYRHRHDAILVGVGTVIADDPSLTTRLPNGGKNPVRIILDTHLRTPIDARVLTDEEAPTWIITGARADEKKIEALINQQVKVMKLPTEEIKIDNLLTLLGDRGITSLFVEGGATVNGSFLEAGAINQVITYIAPKLIGGALAPTMIGGSGFRSMGVSMNLTIKDITMIGQDIKIISVPL
ncbi:diaminohydroxyphosphoribosylaminopyrimidine deaminase/5-amino-6-(5-phosphoribosylamino)uracil reductase [Bacillus tianshenii]|uniref:Riboflavin biosynthesis protein RibD n=1 Tax=Sutcliffiella tianshenii TaxID=1463404 RepID=A0ABS2P4H8_9BACI|nr:bifunctional diaminohydroxyphosphoribosylaminopyrimidine deaminase/5-amino-6-(5-phosphoribosylamino)uracil reductase RibD [Bacillus tianshenii]MBM7621290.1 diaminohydroxyphosphoribosylaminopyrimidine deaminase/5-amino-6-(5-phosphoribosylamino)uracil reductase [Bacillus tianshenii]